MEFVVKWTGLPGSFDAELWAVGTDGEPDEVLASVGGLASMEEVHAWARQQAAAHRDALEPPVAQSGEHTFSL